MQINEGLIYDERSAGGLVFRKDGNKIQWLIIKTTNGRRGMDPVYKFPKGHLKDNEFLKQAALREVEEEAKVKAKILKKMGSNNYIIWDKLTRKKIIKKVTFFLMEYLEVSRLRYYDKEMVLEREWLTIEEATVKLAYDSEKVLLKKAHLSLEEMLKKKGK